MSTALRSLREVVVPAAPVSVIVAGATDQGLVRRRNEDAFGAVDLGSGRPANPGGETFELGTRGVLLAVADGLGGHPDGDVASRVGVDALTAALLDATTTRSGPELVRDAAVTAHEVVCAVAAEREAGARRRLGTTLTAVHVEGAHAHVAHVGDSRAYVLRSGTIHLLTRDQSYTELLVEIGVLDPDQTHLSPYPHSIFQVLGQRNDLEIATSTLDLRDGDVLLVCSDGLTRGVTDTELGIILATSADAGIATRTLLERANQRGGQDNATAVVARICGGPPPSLLETFADTHHVTHRVHFQHAASRTTSPG